MGISLSKVDRIISITNPTTDVTIAELIDTVREWEDELENMTLPYVIDTGGKFSLGGGTYTAKSVLLSDEWQIQFWNGVGQGFIGGGNLGGGVGGNPIKPTGGSDTVTVNNQVGGVIVVSETYDEQIEFIYNAVQEGNISREYTTAVAQNATRNVDVGRLDYITIRIKDDLDADWSTPISTKVVYAWYSQMGDTNPYMIKESD